MHRVALSAPPPGLLVISGVKVLQPHVFRHDSWPIAAAYHTATDCSIRPLSYYQRHATGMASAAAKIPNCTLQPIRHNVRRHRLQCWRRRTHNRNIEFRSSKIDQSRLYPGAGHRARNCREVRHRNALTLHRLNAERMQQLASVRTDHRITLKMGAIRWQEPFLTVFQPLDFCEQDRELRLAKFKNCRARGFRNRQTCG